MTSALAAVTAVYRDVLHAMGDVLFPRGCAGCDRPDTVLCAACTALLHHPVRVPVSDTITSYGYACGRYAGPVRRAVLGWKDHGDEECNAPFAEALTDLVGLISSGIAAESKHYDRIAVVAAPSARTSARRRGRHHVEPLARAVALALRNQGVKAVYCRALESSGVRGRSVQTSSAYDRSRRVSGHIRVRSSGHVRETLRGNTAVVLVDDIITSGATVRACIQACARVHVPVLTVVALAHTPLAS